ncbi:MAG TPA: hypothetical protein VM513_21980 [Kofleriaceae bacterium]|nr:hypothetical protein [Kofleriaceae bacterium]
MESTITAPHCDALVFEKEGRLELLVVGVASQPWTTEQLRARVRHGVEKQRRSADGAASEPWDARHG